MNAESLRQWALRHALPHLSQMRNDVPGLRGAVLASDDGFALAAAIDDAAPTAKLAAMAGAMYGLCAATAREAGLDGCRDIIVDGDSGKIVVMSIPDGGAHRLVLLVLVDAQSAFGHLLLQCRKCCVAIGEELGQYARAA